MGSRASDTAPAAAHFKHSFYPACHLGPGRRACRGARAGNDSASWNMVRPTRARELLGGLCDGGVRPEDDRSQGVGPWRGPQKRTG